MMFIAVAFPVSGNTVDIILAKKIHPVTVGFFQNFVACYIIISESQVLCHIIKAVINKVDIADVILIFLCVGVVFVVSTFCIGVILYPSGVFYFSFPDLNLFLIGDFILQLKNFL